MKRKLAILVLMGFLIPFMVSAQQKTITGTVTAQDGTPISGASIQISGTNRGAVADAQGHFNIQASKGETLVISSLSFVSQNIKVGDGNTIDAVLVPSATMLQATVVTALGITRKAKTLTYSQQTVDNAALTTVKSTNLVNSLQGRVAGVQINRTSGGAGGSVRIVLRGDKSTRNSQPLFVIDGLPVSNPTGGPDAGLYNSAPDAGDILSTLNPDDIKDITILKGASASALYGSQGSNGVILITTNKGQNGVTKVNFSSGITMDQVSLLPDLQFEYGQSTPGTQTSEGSEDSWGSKLGTSGSGDYVKDFFQTGVTWINSIDFSSGTKNSSTYLSYSNTDNKGIIPTSGIKQNTFTLRQSSSFFDNKLTLDGNFMGSVQNTDNRLTPGIYFNPLTGLYMLPRGYNFNDFKNYEYFSQSRYLNAQNWWDINWDKGYVGQDYQQNPYWVEYRDPINTKNQNIYAALSLKYKLNSWLTIQARGNANQFTNQMKRKIYATTQATLSDPNGQVAVGKSTSTNLYGDLLLLGDKKLSENFNLNFTIGTSIQDEKGDGSTIGGALVTPNVFLESAIDWGNSAKSTLSRSEYRRQIQSVFGNVEIGYKDLLFLSLSDRNDWSSTLAFTPTMKKGYNYPSIGANAILSDIFSLPAGITFAKVRASYAVVGNDVDAFATYPLYTFDRGTSSPPGSNPIHVDGFYLQPEKNKSLEIGTQWRFLNDRLSVDFTWYKSNITNQYFSGISVPPGLGAGSSADVNGGNIQNVGEELSVSYRVFKTHNFSWNTSLNISHNKNTVKELFNDKIIANPSPDQQYGLGGGGGYSKLRQGGSFGDLYGRVFKRDDAGHIVVNSATGVPLFEDNKYLGNPNPNWIAGWNNILKIKGFDISFLIDGKFGGEVMSVTEAYLDQMGVSKRSAVARDNGGVTIPNAVDETGKSYTTKTDAMAYYKGIGGKTPINEAYTYSATAIRLRNLSISYQVPLKSSVVKSLSVGIIGNNLFFITRKAPFDPEQVSAVTPGGVGMDVFGLPAYRSFGFSLKCGF